MGKGLNGYFKVLVCGVWGGGLLGQLFAQSADEVKDRTALGNLVVVLAMFTQWWNLLPALSTNKKSKIMEIKMTKSRSKRGEPCEKLKFPVTLLSNVPSIKTSLFIKIF